MIFNITSGGGGGGAIITVTASEGVEVTCSLAPYTFTGTITSESISFSAPKLGTWEITAVKGETTKTDTVEVTEYGVVYNVGFTFENWLFKEGSGAQVTFDTSSVTVSDDYFRCGGMPVITTHDQVDVTDYSKITIEYVATSGHVFKLGLTQSSQDKMTPSRWSPTKTLTDKTTKGEESFDISSYSGSYFIGLSGNITGSGNTFTGYNWYLE